MKNAKYCENYKCKKIIIIYGKNIYFNLFVDCAQSPDSCIISNMHSTIQGIVLLFSFLCLYVVAFSIYNNQYLFQQLPLPWYMNVNILLCGPCCFLPLSALYFTLHEDGDDSHALFFLSWIMTCFHDNRAPGTLSVYF